MPASAPSLFDPERPAPTHGGAVPPGPATPTSGAEPRAAGAWRTVRGQIVGIVAQDPTGRSIRARFRPIDGSAMLTVVGPIPPALREGAALTVMGRTVAGRTGPVFHVRTARAARTAPALIEPSPDAVAALMAVICRGVGPKTARTLVDQLGPTAWTLWRTAPDTMARTVGPAKAAQWHKAITDLGAPQATTLAHLLELGLSWAVARRVWRSAGAKAVPRIRRNPYWLIGLRGIQFATADRIAQAKFAVPPDDPRRLAALMTAVMVTAAREGHTSLPRPQVVARAQAIGKCAAYGLDAAALIETALADGRLATDLGDIYLPRLLRAEQTAAAGLALLITRPPVVDAAMLEQDPTLACYDPEQRRAIATAVAGGVTLINGRPGTGKTTVAREIVRLAYTTGRAVHLTATTGKAADQLQATILSRQLPGSAPLTAPVPPGRTIHDVVAQAEQVGTLPPGVILVDEASMLDLPLLARLLRFCGPATSLVFLGDPNQLPPVMAGNSSRDLRDASVVPTIELIHVHRQARHSLIALNAERILQGKMPIFGTAPISKQALKETGRGDLAPEAIVRDTYQRVLQSPLHGVDLVQDTVQRLQANKGYDPVRDIQVYVPTKKGLLGTQYLNRTLQATLNPTGTRVRGTGTLTFPVELPPLAPGTPGTHSGSRLVPAAGDVILLGSRLADRQLPAGTRLEVLHQTTAGGVHVRHTDGPLVQTEFDLTPAQLSTCKVVFDLELRVGDPVIQRRTDKVRGVTNGMRGVLQAVTPEGGAVVAFDGRQVTYTKGHLAQVDLAYALTVHKGQGQELKVAILVASHTEHRILLDKSLLYVGLTRAKELAIYVGTGQALRVALQQTHGLLRRTRLAERTAEAVVVLAATQGHPVLTPPVVPPPAPGGSTHWGRDRRVRPETAGPGVAMVVAAGPTRIPRPPLAAPSGSDPVNPSGAPADLFGAPPRRDPLRPEGHPPAVSHILSGDAEPASPTPRRRS